MKFVKAKLFLLALPLILASCMGVHSPLTSNVNNHNTVTQLDKKNYKVIAAVSGEAEVTYILGFGGMRKSALIELARKNMLANADLVGKPRALAYETVEIYNRFYPFWNKVKVVVHGFVVEFE